MRKQKQLVVGKAFFFFLMFLFLLFLFLCFIVLEIENFLERALHVGSSGSEFTCGVRCVCLSLQYYKGNVCI